MKKAGVILKNAGEVNPALYNSELDETAYDGEQYKNFTALFNFIRMKDIVSEFIWYALTGTLVCSMAFNYIQNVGCFRSVEEMKKTHDDYLKQEQNIQEKKSEKENNATVYKSYE